MLGRAGHLSLEGGEVGGDAGDVEGDDGLLAFFAEEEGAVGVGVHEGQPPLGNYGLSKVLQVAENTLVSKPK